jgi:hypothetical protein
MTYKLKPGAHAIEIVDGPLAGRRYLPDQVYAEVPPGYEDRFERADKAPLVQMPKRGKPPAKDRIADERA